MRGYRRSHRDLSELAGRQHGVVSGAQLVELGFSDDAIWRQVANSRLHRLRTGVFAVGHTGVSRHGEAMAAVLAAGPGSLLSHRSAAWLWGLTARWQKPVEVTAATPRRQRPGIRVHSAAAHTSEDRSQVEEVPVTAIPRTLLDFAAVDSAYLGRALDNAERLGLLDLDAIDALIARSAGFRGVGRLRRALEIFRIPEFTRSGLERRFLALLRRRGISVPKANCFVEGYELDMYWAEERFAVELDTYDYHGGHAAFEADRTRQEELKLAGVEMIRVTGARLSRDPDLVLDRLERHLAQRRRDLGR